MLAGEDECGWIEAWVATEAARVLAEDDGLGVMITVSNQILAVLLGANVAVAMTLSVLYVIIHMTSYGLPLIKTIKNV
ncbi:hypothetical protein QP166_09445 [Sphingomonas sp. LR60]|uniref:hypothetical protein n=1 Tax=Sphingomonas sp. LR60 TaxID=3050233 RepID=UPI002FE2510B